jgi:hypothetical protein
MARDYLLFPRDENGDALWNMSEQGDDLSKGREFDFCVIFPTDEAALRFAMELLRMGQKVSFSRYMENSEYPWQVKAHPWLHPTHKAITDFEEQLGRGAASLGGRNDGWGCMDQS